MSLQQLRERAELIEIAAWRDLFEAARPRDRDRLGLGWTAIDGTLALRATGVDSLLFNRVLGLGRAGPVSGPLLDEIVAGYARAGIRRMFVHVAADPDAPPQLELRRRLLIAGLLRFHRSWVKLSRDRGPLEVESTRPNADRHRVRVRPAGMADAPTVAGIISQGLAIPTAGRPLLEAVVGRPGWHAFVAEIGGLPIAAGLLFERDGVGYLAGGATVPAHRRRGAHKAVLEARVRRAFELGCRLVTSETGEAVRGEPNSSFDNMVRLGLRPIGLRDNYARPATKWEAA